MPLSFTQTAPLGYHHGLHVQCSPCPTSYPPPSLIDCFSWLPHIYFSPCPPLSGRVLFMPSFSNRLLKISLSTHASPLTHTCPYAPLSRRLFPMLPFLTQTAFMVHLSHTPLPIPSLTHRPLTMPSSHIDWSPFLSSSPHDPLITFHDSSTTPLWGNA